MLFRVSTGVRRDAYERTFAEGRAEMKKAETLGAFCVSAFFLEELAATYSRGVYKTTTIGKTVFDGRVRNGIGSDHSFMATKKLNTEMLKY
jgi:hypothetical protein